MEDKDGAASSKRVRTLTPKALQNALDEKEKWVNIAVRKLSSVIHDAALARSRADKIKAISDLENATQTLSSILNQLGELYVINVPGHTVHVNEKLLEGGNELLNHANVVINQIKNKQTDKSSDICSKSCGSKSSLALSNSSVRLRAKAAAALAAAQKDAEYERLVAEREFEQKRKEAEDKTCRENERAMYEKDMAILAANRKVAVASAELEAIDLSIAEEEGEIGDEVDDLLIDRRTEEWVQAQQNIPTIPPEESRPREGIPPRFASTPIAS